MINKTQGTDTNQLFTNTKILSSTLCILEHKLYLFHMAIRPHASDAFKEIEYRGRKPCKIVIKSKLQQCATAKQTMTRQSRCAYTLKYKILLATSLRPRAGHKNSQIL